MNATLAQHENRCRMRIEGQITVASAEHLKTLLLQWIAAGRNLELDLRAVDEIDITAMQLLWAAVQESGRSGASLIWHASDLVSNAVRDAGFDLKAAFELRD